MKTFGPLYAKSSTGKIKQWCATAQKPNILVTSNGYVDGKATIREKPVKGKNIGRSNETTPFQQACSDAQSKMNKKMDEGYVLDQKDLEGQVLLLPMLAHPYGKRKHDIKYPALVQPKLNGVRCLADNDCKYHTRKGKEYYSLDHLNTEVKAMLSMIGASKLLDGEIFHPDWGFQEIIRAVKKYRPGVSEELQYWVYDIVDTEMDFDDRSNLLNCLKDLKHIVIVPTYQVQNEEEMLAKHKEFTAAGFEGTIIRNIEGKYELKNRSKNLQKYKDFIDDEYEIVGGTEASGDDAGTVVFTCKLKGDSDKTFSVRPKGSRETRRKWFTNLDSIIGKQLTVRYQELSEDKVPIFPVGLVLRDYE